MLSKIGCPSWLEKGRSINPRSVRMANGLREGIGAHDEDEVTL